MYNSPTSNTAARLLIRSVIVVQWLQYVFDAQQSTSIGRSPLECYDKKHLCSKWWTSYKQKCMISRQIVPSTRCWDIRKKIVAENGFDPLPSGLWARPMKCVSDNSRDRVMMGKFLRASAAPLSFPQAWCCLMETEQMLKLIILIWPRTSASGLTRTSQEAT